jgi:hypothetical protein
MRLLLCTYFVLLIRHCIQFEFQIVHYCPVHLMLRSNLRRISKLLLNCLSAIWISNQN